MTMIRTLLCTILLSAACQANAATLYRWAESDGSLTFSPVPPPAGVAFETIETGGDDSASQAGDSTQQNLAQSNASATAAEASAAPTAPIAVAAAPTANPQIKISAIPDDQSEPLNDAAQELAYAPNTANNLPQGISSASPSAAAPQSAGEAQQNGVVASSKKFEQCQELQKRVVSLERRLRSKLTPDDVDNTVVAIVRYQNSFDNHCE